MAFDYNNVLSHLVTWTLAALHTFGDIQLIKWILFSGPSVLPYCDSLPPPLLPLYPHTHPSHPAPRIAKMSEGVASCFFPITVLHTSLILLSRRSRSSCLVRAGGFSRGLKDTSFLRGSNLKNFVALEIRSWDYSGGGEKKGKLFSQVGCS